MVCLESRCPLKWAFLNKFLCRCKVERIPSLPRIQHSPQEARFIPPLFFVQYLVGVLVTVVAIYCVTYFTRKLLKGMNPDCQNPPIPPPPAEESQDDNNIQPDDGFISHLPQPLPPSPLFLLGSLEHEVVESGPRVTFSPSVSQSERTEMKEEEEEEEKGPERTLSRSQSRDSVVPFILFPIPTRSHSQPKLTPSPSRVHVPPSRIPTTPLTAIYFKDVTFTWKRGGHQVYLTGSFFNWDSRIPMVKDVRSGIHTVTITLQNGRHEYKFIVDREWTLATDQPHCDNRIGTRNHFIIV